MPDRRRRAARRLVTPLLIGIVTITLIGCSGDDGSNESGEPAATNAPSTTTSAVPAPADPDWTVDTPESHGIDLAGLDTALEYAFVPERNTQGVVVVHDGAIVAERYGPDADATSVAASWSVAKSFTGALVGIAIEDGLIDGVDEPMSTWIPEWEGTPKGDITLIDVLRMQSGLDFNEDYDIGALEDSDIIQMIINHTDQFAYAESRPVAHEPGTRFNYSSGDTLLLGRVIESATGMSTGDYAEQELFDPLGIDDATWWQDAEGNTLTYCCLDMATRDFARFGQLYLDEGRWGDDQLVPEEWVRDSTTAVATSEDVPDYGYQIWVGPEDPELPHYFSFLGFDGQYVYVVPEYDLVIVRNGIYRRSDCEPVADPNLIGCYAAFGINPQMGTVPPSDWSDTEFLTPILEAIDAP